VFPDGGVARLRLFGSLTDEGLAQVRERWAQTTLRRLRFPRIRRRVTPCAGYPPATYSAAQW